MKSMMSAEEVTKLIHAGERMLLAGSEKKLQLLPPGNWVGGTIPYFISESGGMLSNDLIQVTLLPSAVSNVKVVAYDSKSIGQIPSNYFNNGLSFIQIPAFSDVHRLFAENCFSWSGLFNQPLVGWVAGVELNVPGLIPKVFDGTTGKSYQDHVVVMHLQLKEGIFARANIINLFKQGNGPTLKFLEGGFSANKVLVDGKETSFKEFLLENKIDLRLPLVADYMGAMINVSFQALSVQSGEVTFYAPVVPGVEYRIAKPVENYEEQFAKALEEHSVRPLFACNCILNYLYAKLEGKKTGSIVSAMTFGEVAYILLNQTFVYITLEV